MTTRELKIEPDPVIEAYKKDIDRTLLRENLRLTVEERFETAPERILNESLRRWCPINRTCVERLPDSHSIGARAPFEMG